MKSAVLAVMMLLFVCAAVTEELYAEGQDSDQLYRAKCTSCHRLYPPQEHTYQKFQTYVAKYGKGLSDEERRKLLEYLQENAKQEKEKGG